MPRLTDHTRDSTEAGRILEASSDAGFILDRHGLCVAVNAAGTEFLGQQREQILGADPLEWLRPPLSTQVRAAFLEVLCSGADRRIQVDLDGAVQGSLISLGGGGTGKDAGVALLLRTGPAADGGGDRQAALLESNAKLRAILDALPIGVVVKDRQSRFELVNKELTDRLGLALEEFLGRRSRDIRPPDVAVQAEALERKALDAAGPVSAEVMVTERDGTVRHYLETKFPIVDAGGAVMGLGGLSADITARKKMELSLRETENRFRAIFEDSGIGMATVDEEGRYLSVNRSLCEMLGYPEGELIGRSSLDLTHPAEREEGRRLLDDFVAGRIGNYAVEKRYLRKDGSEVWASVAVSMVRDRQGEPLFGLRQVQDITERRQTEMWMQTLSLAIEQYPGGVCITDPAGYYEYANPSYRRETGYSLGELIGKTPDTLDPDGPGSQRSRQIWRSVRAGEVWRGEVWNHRKDGSRYLANLQIHPIKDAEGRVTHFVGLTEDITQQREMAERLRQSEKLEVVGQLTGGVAHDFNNILAVILTNAEILEETLAPDDRRRASVSAILRAASRAAKMTERLLVFSRRQELRPERVDLASLVRELVDILQRSLGETIVVRSEIDGPVPPVAIDVTQFENALLNLAVNARDAMPDGGNLTISVRQEAEFAVIDVVDTGTGISQEVIGRIFEPFFTTKPRGAGTGLGLSMVYGFLAQSGGDIAVESVVGRGDEVPPPASDRRRG